MKDTLMIQCTAQDPSLTNTVFEGTGSPSNSLKFSPQAYWKCRYKLSSHKSKAEVHALAHTESWVPPILSSNVQQVHTTSIAVVNVGIATEE